MEGHPEIPPYICAHFVTMGPLPLLLKTKGASMGITKPCNFSGSPKGKVHCRGTKDQSTDRSMN
jgi:hypothetical protein